FERREGVPQPAAGKKLFLIDAMSLVFRAFFAPMQTALVSPTGMPTKAIYIFVRTLRKLLKDHQPDSLAVAFDLAAPTFRDELFEEYKANRPEFPEDLAVQLPYVRRFCQALGFPLVEKEGFEADDVIGTLAKEGAEKGLDVSIVSGDEDLFQLVNDRVRVLKPARGGSDGETLCDAEKVKEILGVEPAQVVDWLALTGDPSDNIPGARPLPGQEPPSTTGKKRSYIGPKGATELIRRFGALEKVLESYEQVERQSYREALRDFRNEALLSRELATIRTDVPLEVGAGDLGVGEADLNELTALCQELGFSSLLREFLEQTPAPVTAEIESAELRTPKAVEKWLKVVEAQAPLAIGFANEGEEGFGGRIAGLGLSDGRRLATVPLDSSAETTALLGVLKPAFEDASRPKSIHNAKLLQLLLGKEKVPLAGVADDVMLYSYLLEPLASSHALAEIVLRRRGRKVSGSLAEAAELTRELAALLAPEIVREGLKHLYDEIELPLAAVLAEVEAVGVRLDAEILAKMSGEFDKELADLTREIYDLAGEAFDIDSPKQLGELLFEKLKLPGGRRLKKSGQYSTEASVLESLAARHELPRKIIDYRTRAKLKSTYIDALPRFINPATGRLHTSFNQTVARTGRLSSSNPNLQNIPIGEEFGLRIRSAFVAEPGWRLISADYSQIELRVLAHMSGDPVLIEAFSRGEDIHSRTAQEIFGVPPGLQTHEHRRMAKAINYGVIYGLSSFGLAGRTGSSKTEAQRYIDAYFARYKGVKRFLDGVIEEARQSGRVRTLFGRLRPIPEINSKDAAARNRAEREAMNTPLQGTAADLLKLAMVKAHARVGREKMRTRMILTVHDELVFEAPESEVDAAREIVRAEMEGAFPMKVPLRVDLGVGKNWKEAK
ncbi:MAG TPA: DNA polymerase I, partial [Terriglobia bacterium]|nr:DNA polymerase I [Terriglobia bacterium]